MSRRGSPARAPAITAARAPAIAPRRWLSGAFLAVLLAGCAAVPPPLDRAAGEVLSGRLSVRVDGEGALAPRSVNAAFELQGDARAGRLNLVTPLGNVLAQARWAPGTVVLATPEGERNFDDLDALTREVLGESLPLAAMFDWLRGRPWTGAASTATSPPAEAGFEQAGWVVSLARFSEGWVAARRELPPVVVVRAKLDPL